MTTPADVQHSNPRWLPIAGLLLMLSGILAFAPLAPVQPGAGLDDSWRLAMNQAVAEGLVTHQMGGFEADAVSRLLALEHGARGENLGENRGRGSSRRRSRWP